MAASAASSRRSRKRSRERRSATRCSITLEPEDAFGEYDAELLRVEPRARFPETLEVGMQFEGVPGDDGNEDEQKRASTPSPTSPSDSVVVDANHPFAGERLWFKCAVKEVRAATGDEIEARPRARRLRRAPHAG